MPEIYHALLDTICGSQSEHLFKKVRLSKRLSKIKTSNKKSFQEKCSEALYLLAERVGFEPTVAHHHT